MSNSPETGFPEIVALVDNGRFGTENPPRTYTAYGVPLEKQAFGLSLAGTDDTTN